MKCPKCKSKFSKRYNCKFCCGKEELDWVENILGVEETFDVIQNRAIGQASRQLCKEIDKQVLKNILEKNNVK